MTEESAINFLKAKGYSIKPPAVIKNHNTGGYRIETAEGDFFMDGFEGEEKQIKEIFESKGKTVKSVVFQPDGFYFL